MCYSETNEADKFEFKRKFSIELPDGNIPAFIDHVRAFPGEEELIKPVCHTFVIFRLADSDIDA